MKLCLEVHVILQSINYFGKIKLDQDQMFYYPETLAIME